MQETDRRAAIERNIEVDIGCARPSQLRQRLVTRSTVSDIAAGAVQIASTADAVSVPALAVFRAPSTSRHGQANGAVAIGDDQRLVVFRFIRLVVGVELEAARPSSSPLWGCGRWRGSAPNFGRCRI
jgi:hypothetical protein